MKVNDLNTPALVVDVDKVKRNADRMLKRCKEYGVDLRPHFKTSKAVQAAVMQTGGTKRRMAVSTLAEAELLEKNGFDDILYAYPFSNCPSKISRCAVLNEKLLQFHVMINQRRQVEEIIMIARKSSKSWSVIIAVDCGYRREGVRSDSEELVEMAKMLNNSQHIRFQGLYCHNGHSYCAEGKLEIYRITDLAVSRLLMVVERLKSNGIECKTYGLGSTPVCSQPSETTRKVTEWHPGCYIFYDLQQWMIGGCQLDDIAAVVVTRILGHYSYDGGQHLLVDCGWTALTLQGGGKVPSGGYGGIVNHPELKLESMTQEIGKIVAADGHSLNFDDYPVGSTLRVYPYHACATCSMHPRYYVANSEDEIIDEWTPARGW